MGQRIEIDESTKNPETLPKIQMSIEPDMAKSTKNNKIKGQAELPEINTEIKLNDETEAKIREADLCLRDLDAASDQLTDKLSPKEFAETINDKWTSAKSSVARLANFEGIDLEYQERLKRISRKIITYLNKQAERTIKQVEKDEKALVKAKAWLALLENITPDQMALGEKLVIAQTVLVLERNYKEAKKHFEEVMSQVNEFYDSLKAGSIEDTKQEARRAQVRNRGQDLRNQIGDCEANFSSSLKGIPSDGDKAAYQEKLQQISDWYSQSGKRMAELQQAEDLFTYMASEAYGKQYSTILAAKANSEMVTYYQSVNISDDSLSPSPMNADVAEKICLERWIKYSLKKYDEYIQNVENFSGSPFVIDPHIPRKYLETKKEGELRPLSEVKDAESKFADFGEIFNLAVLKVEEIEKEISQTLSGNKLEDLRALDMVETRVKDTAPCLILAYMEKRLSLTESISDGLRIQFLSLQKQYQGGYLEQACTESQRLADQLQGVDREEISFIQIQIDKLEGEKKKIVEGFAENLSRRLSGSLSVNDEKDLEKAEKIWNEIGVLPYADRQIPALKKIQRSFTEKIATTRRLKKQVAQVAENSHLVLDELDRIKDFSPRKMLKALNEFKKTIPASLGIPKEITDMTQMAENIKKPIESANAMLAKADADVLGKLEQVESLDPASVQTIFNDISRLKLQVQKVQQRDKEDVNALTEVAGQLEKVATQLDVVLTFSSLDREIQREDANLNTCLQYLEKLSKTHSLIHNDPLWPKIKKIQKKYDNLLGNEENIKDTVETAGTLLGNRTADLDNLLDILDELQKAAKIPSTRKREILRFQRRFQDRILKEAQNRLRRLIRDPQSISIEDAKWALNFYLKIKDEREQTQQAPDGEKILKPAQGAYHEAVARKALENKDFEAAYVAWSKAEGKEHSLAVGHRLAVLKLLAIQGVTSRDKNIRWLFTALDESYLKNDAEINRLKAFRSMCDLDRQRETPAAFMGEEDHTAKYLVVINQLESLVKLDDKSEELSPEENVRDGNPDPSDLQRNVLFDILQVWGEYREYIGEDEGQIPPPPSDENIRQRTIYRQQKFPVLASCIKEVKRDARLIHIHSGQKKAKKICEETTNDPNDHAMLTKVWELHRDQVIHDLT